MITFEPCKSCFGRGYKPEARKPSKRNPHGNGFYARSCRACGGSGQKEAKSK
jgi:DnaJ-class molecular chaperone